MRGMSIAAAVLCGSLSVGAAAASGLKPGQWEITVTMDMGKDTPQIPPEQLEQMKRMGIQMPFARPTVFQHCITPQQAASDEPPPMQADREGNSCKNRDFKRSGNHVSGEVVCEGRMQGTGKFAMDFEGDRKYTSTWSFTGTSDGRPVDMHSSSSARWLRASCGK